MSVECLLSAANLKMQYDCAAKELVSEKIILAHIISKTIPEFEGMAPEDIIPFIEDPPYIGDVFLDPGITNASNMQNASDTTKAVSFNTEDNVVNEGLIRFDVIYYIRTHDYITKLILDVEIQKDKPSNYDILNRATYYVCRVVSSQKGRDFLNTNYNAIKQVYSVWLRPNMK